jgi:hypothetical protein
MVVPNLLWKASIPWKKSWWHRGFSSAGLAAESLRG